MPPSSTIGAGGPPSDAPFGALADPQAGAADAQQQLTDLMGQIRELVSQVDELVGMNPMLAQDGQQIRTILKGMIVKAAKQAPTQSDSSMQVPPAGM